MSSDDIASGQSFEQDEYGFPLKPIPFESSLEQCSHQQLLNLLKQGNPEQKAEILSAIYGMYRWDVWRFIRKQVSSEAEAKRIFVRVWYVAFEKLCEFEWNEEPPPETDTPIKTWLITTARYKCLEYFSEQKKERKHIVSLNDNVQILIQNDNNTDILVDESSPSDPSPSPTTVQSQVNEPLKKAMLELSDKQQEIIRLFYFEGKNSTEIGQILRMKPGTVRKSKRTALLRLRSLLNLEGVKS